MEIKDKAIPRRNILLISCAIFLVFALIFAFVSILINDRQQGQDITSEYNKDLSSVSIFDNTADITDENFFEASEAFYETSDEISVSPEDSSYDSSENTLEEDELQHGWVINKYGYTYLYDDSGYEQFNYSTQTLERYVNSLNHLSSLIPAETKIYSITVPVSTTFMSIPREIYTEDNFYNKSQSAFVSTVESKLNNITNISVIPKLESEYNNGEYLFFRTDKNWTQLGAYYAYTVYCESAGLSAYSLSNFPKIEAGEYLGRFYLATQSEKMKKNPDFLLGYSTLPSVKTSLTVYDDGIVYSDYVLCANEVDIDNAYDVFLGISAGRYEINTTSEGGNLLIIGDSSAYPIIPFLTSHYSKIDMIDPQYFDTSLEEFLDNRAYSDVLVMCYSTNATSGNYIPCLNTMAGVTTNDE